MKGDKDGAKNYEALLREVMQRPIRREGFVLPDEPFDQRCERERGLYKRWLAQGTDKSTNTRR